MDIIKTYLDNMFQNLPNTPQVQRAREELLQMMEDKYTELKEEGKTENEAIGIVISEFGNLDELAEGLGIQSVMKQQEGKEETSGRWMNRGEAECGLAELGKRAWMISFGVLLCILSPVSTIFCDALEVDRYENLLEGIGVCIMFVLVAAAVVLFVLSGGVAKDWKEGNFRLNEEAEQYVQKEKRKKSGIFQLLIAVGIAVCVLSVVPPIMVDSLDIKDPWEDLSGGMLLILVAIGVFMIVYGAMKKENYNRLLHLGEHGAGDVKDKTVYKNPFVNTFMSVYWSTATCVYLCWSFLTFDWHISWIVWPIAAVLYNILKSIFGEEYEEVR